MSSIRSSSTNVKIQNQHQNQHQNQPQSQWQRQFNPSICERGWKVASSLIGSYKLHHAPQEPVDLLPLLQNFDVRFMELPERTHGFNVDMEDLIIIALNDKLSTEQTRFVAAHEIGHVALWHPNALNACLAGRWFYDRLELEASAVAAYLLLPASAISGGLKNKGDKEGQSYLEKVATHYLVPPELVLMRRALYAQSGY